VDESLPCDGLKYRLERQFLAVEGSLDDEDVDVSQQVAALSEVISLKVEHTDTRLVGWGLTALLTQIRSYGTWHTHTHTPDQLLCNLEGIQLIVIYFIEASLTQSGWT